MWRKRVKNSKIFFTFFYYFPFDTSSHFVPYAICKISAQYIMYLRARVFLLSYDTQSLKKRANMLEGNYSTPSINTFFIISIKIIASCSSHNSRPSSEMDPRVMLRILPQGPINFVTSYFQPFHILTWIFPTNSFFRILSDFFRNKKFKDTLPSHIFDLKKLSFLEWSQKIFTIVDYSRTIKFVWRFILQENYFLIYCK